MYIQYASWCIFVSFFKMIAYLSGLNKEKFAKRETEREGHAGRGRTAEWAMPISPKDGRKSLGVSQSLVRLRTEEDRWYK